MEEIYCVYIRYSEAYDRFYVGHTNSIERRIDEHNSGRNKSTSPYLPWRLIGVIKKPDKSSAVALEFKLKNQNLCSEGYYLSSSDS